MRELVQGVKEFGTLEYKSMIIIDLTQKTSYLLGIALAIEEEV